MEDLVVRVKEAATQNKLACRKAFELAEQLGVPIAQVGEAANRAGVKIAACQLGCFK